MTDIERQAITRQGEQLARAFGIEFDTSGHVRGLVSTIPPRLRPGLEQEITDHLRIMAFHSKKGLKLPLATVTALLFFGIALPESKAEPRAKAEAAP